MLNSFEYNKKFLSNVSFIGKGTARNFDIVIPVTRVWNQKLFGDVFSMKNRLWHQSQSVRDVLSHKHPETAAVL